VVTFVRHGLKTHWESLESVEQFFEYWLVNLIALAVFVAISVGTILACSKFFLGLPGERFGERLVQIQFHVVMAILVGVILLFLLMELMPGEYDLL
jgi:uncharacterized membrane protein YhaH (DUF805 family)